MLLSPVNAFRCTHRFFLHALVLTRCAVALALRLEAVMGDSADSELQIKFRHVLGDVGPFSFNDTATIQSVKETIFTRWPSGAHATGSWQQAG